MASSLFNSTARTSLCRSCRTFSSTAAVGVGPESPNYIEVPPSLQPDLASKRRVRGTLPVPREIFPARRPDKPTQAFIKAATTEPTKKQSTQVKGAQKEYNEYNAWKTKMAATRRQNLREGIVELHKRKQNTLRAVRTRSNTKQAQRDHILHQPPREDDRLTSSSTIAAMQPTRTPTLPDPDREERFKLSQERVKAKQAQKEAERMDALHTLYMNARNFITTERELARELDRVFPAGMNEAWANDQRYGDNIWNLGAPPTLESMVNDAKLSEAAKWDTSQERMKKIAETLTGGKM
ncbi:hypothetical protein FQN54_001819 [Arachnomyces sp. PD_36]|nr:hypothetical protein FQN54_001819 [Arachnomyces sp. PD_36]